MGVYQSRYLSPIYYRFPCQFLRPNEEECRLSSDVENVKQLCVLPCIISFAKSVATISSFVTELQDASTVIDCLPF